MNEKLSKALDHISDRHIADAAAYKKRRPYRFGAIAAALALVILVSVIVNPITTTAVSLADYSQGDRSFYGEVNGYMDGLSQFWAASMRQILSGSDGNQAFSPANLYMALSAVAELTGGDGQILQVLGENTLADLQDHTGKIWNVCYQDEGNKTLLANSLWLDDGLSYNQDVMDRLAQHHYTSVYQGDIGSALTNNAISAWLNEHTGNMLKDSTDSIRLDPSTIFALYSTVYFQAKWSEEFQTSNNTDGIFHSPQGDTGCTYMNKKLLNTFYYWGEDFAAVSLQMKDGSRMWLILPDEDKDAAQVLASGEYMDMLLNEQYEKQKYMKVNLSLPKFDIRSGGNLAEDLKAMGITDVFNPNTGAFSGAFPGFDGPIWLDAVNQATRVAIDEKGVTAANYLELPVPGSTAPPEEIIDFILDRPFLFVVTNFADVPLFAGLVNQP